MQLEYACNSERGASFLAESCRTSRDPCMEQKDFTKGVDVNVSNFMAPYDCANDKGCPRFATL
jgi:hypothetical protein